ncbi:TetR/AcrR family transcriptional regulator [Corynebacterium choanae]|uniref:Transcriptional regulator, TetR family n=1 Tax=Corynebacterium choanae TaxID=1862358 RepID=A0A3G6JC02_9CORY|nr:TetR/AcrR family transcriptional regulator [Corynebacterium choanae]AZA13684.1 Transcriptional regulator, TetR family [Corynebacterium choanae]
MRRDAALRRQALIESACSLFRKHAHQVPLEAIAADAGVGIATLYRNFPDRQALLHACGMHVFHQIIALQEDLLQHFTEDPASHWQRYTSELVELGVGTMVATFAPEHLDQLPADVLANRDKAGALGEEIVSLAAEAGLVHDTLSHTIFLAGLVNITRPPVPGLIQLAPNIEQFLVDTYLRGLRPVPFPT